MLLPALVSALWLIAAWKIVALTCRGSDGNRLGFWQLTLVQFILCALLGILSWMIRMVYLDRYGPA